MNDFSVKSVLKKNVMTMALFGIYVLFVILAFLLKSTNMLEPSIVSSLIEQNAYVFVLGAGMLMCMLTGGNIDLSVGSVVCFVGAIVGLFSVENRIIHMPLSVPVVLLIAIGVGVAYGSLLGFLIAYVRIPPWIATLAGYLAFRGLGTQILTKASETNAISIPSTDALGELSDIFSGRLFETDWGEINIPCIIMGLIGIAVFAFLTISARRKKIVKGYQADPLWYVVTKLVLVSLVILFFTVEFSFDGGMPTVASNMDIVVIAKACGYPNAISVSSFAQLDRVLNEAKSRNELSLIEVKCSIGARADLGRPTTTAIENKENFKGFL